MDATTQIVLTAARMANRDTHGGRDWAAVISASGVDPIIAEHLLLERPDADGVFQPSPLSAYLTVSWAPPGETAQGWQFTDPGWGEALRLLARFPQRQAQPTAAPAKPQGIPIKPLSETHKPLWGTYKPLFKRDQ